MTRETQYGTPQELLKVPQQKFDPYQAAKNAQKAEKCCAMIDFYGDNACCTWSTYLLIGLLSSVCSIVSKYTTGKTNSAFYGMSVAGWILFAVLTLPLLVQTCTACCDCSAEEVDNQHKR